MNPSTTEVNAQRALAAIVLTDAVSFSARMSVDEEGTLALIQRDLKLIADLCDNYQGQVLKSTGDGLLMSFSSAVQAVSCSQVIQQELTKLSEGLMPEDYLQHRIGIHLGDVLFSHSDVLGNGVNIAARLQTHSVPGGICISQTIYDVVKARLNINPTFLGPLKLKNIQEPVPAFQIPPYGQAQTTVHQPHSSLLDSVDETPLAAIAQKLQQSNHARRIKKLVFGAAQRKWENDPVVLSQFELLPLLDKLQQQHSNLESLRQTFQKIAAKLNRKTEYLAVADIILQALAPIYETLCDPGKGCTAEQTRVTDRQSIYRAISENLDQQAEQLRIKKLLYAVVHGAWENDPKVLANHLMIDLVAAVHEITATEADLTNHLERIVKRLNRQSRYTHIALLISEAFHQLYGTAPVRAPRPVSDTMMETVPPIEQTIMSAPDPVSVEDGVTCMTHVKGAEGLSQPQLDNPSQQASPIEVAAAPWGSEVKSRDRDNLFQLRLEIMRYTNPLRAKVLLLSTVRSPFSFSQQDWITLKSKTLDDLVRDTFDYCQTYADLESKLTIMCHCVGDVGENLQSAGAILQAMKPFYATALSP